MKRDPQTASDLLSVGLSTEAERATDSHTPGPWVQHLDTVWRGGHEIVCHPVNDPRSIADARLVAAAPELLAFVRDYAENADCGDGGDGDACKTGNCWHCSAVQLVRKATVAQ